ncbi:hypothetical protein KAR91_25675 [Candidatus Pacearchaeota archaeon]|nr:hypothetical protein [Candidatus Pacearchaeota archaeon]
MPRKRKNDTIVGENWVKVKRLSERDKAIKTLKQVKARDKGKKFKKVPLDSPRAFKLVEIK